MMFLFAKAFGRWRSTLERIAEFVQRQAQASFLRRVLTGNAVMTEKTAREELAQALQVFQVSSTSAGLLLGEPLTANTCSSNAEYILNGN